MWVGSAFRSVPTAGAASAESSALSQKARPQLVPALVPSVRRPFGRRGDAPRPIWSFVTPLTGFEPEAVGSEGALPSPGAGSRRCVPPRTIGRDVGYRMLPPDVVSVRNRGAETKHIRPVGGVRRPLARFPSAARDRDRGERRSGPVRAIGILDASVKAAHSGALPRRRTPGEHDRTQPLGSRAGRRGGNMER